MGRVSLNPIGEAGDVSIVSKRLQSALTDLEDQLNVRPTLYSIAGSKVPKVKTGDVVFSTSGDTVSNIRVKTGKDSFATVDQDSIGITLSTLGVSAGAIAQITAGAITQTSLGITLTSLGVSAGAQTQIIAGAITQASIGISSGAITQITSGAIVLTGGGASSLGVTAGVATQITTLSTLSAATLGITLTTFSVLTNWQTQLTTGIPAAGSLCAPPAYYESGHSKLRFKGYYSGGSGSTILTQDGDFCFYHDTGANKTYIGLFEGATRRYVELNI